MVKEMNEFVVSFNLVLWHFKDWHVVLCAEDVKYRRNYELFTVVNERKWFISVSCFLSPAVAAWLQPVVSVHFSMLWKSTCWDLRSVFGIIYGKITLSLCVNAAESRDCFENSVGAFKDIRDLTAGCLAGTFAFKKQANVRYFLHQFKVDL